MTLSGRNRAINEVEIIRKDEAIERNLVILHGYGAGLGLFYRYLSLVARILDFVICVFGVWQAFG